MRKFQVSDREHLTEEVICKIIQEFSTEVVGELKNRENYDNGKHKILLRKATDASKPNEKVVCNLVREVNDTYTGYAVGITPTFAGLDEMENINDILNYSDMSQICESYFRDCCVYGTAAALCYVNEYGKQQLKVLNPKEIIPVYDNTISENLVAVIRIYNMRVNGELQPEYYCDVYDDRFITNYKSTPGYSSLSFIQRYPHNYQQCPITVFSLNENQEALCQQGFGLVDTYESLYSDSVNNWNSFCDAYLCLYGMTADDDDLANMKNHRILIMDSDAKAEYLTKETSVTEIQNLMKNTEDKFREIVNCPCFADEAFGTSSGIALQFKLLGMENRVSGILANMKKALTRIIELLAEVERLVNPDMVIENLDIQFHRNIPVDKTAEAQMINLYRGLVSDETLLGQVSFVNDVQAEMEKMKLQRENNLTLFQYQNTEEDE